MTPDDLLSMLLEESDRQRAQFSRRQGTGKGKDEIDEALVASQAQSLKGKGKKDLTCWNCNKKSHISHHCKAPRKPKTGNSEVKQGDGKSGGSGKPSGSGTANAAVESSEDGGAWMAEELEGEELDWFELVIEEMEAIKKGDVVEDLKDTSGHAFVAIEPADSNGIVEMYDSGCTNHISPYRDQFQNLVKITPRIFKAANQQHFSAIGKGDLLVNIPDGNSYSRLRLQNVLFSPNVAYTLVSIGRLDEAGFTTLFGRGKCVLSGPDGTAIGEVARSPHRVYKVVHEEGIANAAIEALTLGQLHR